MTDIIKTDPVDPPSQTNAPPIDIPDADVDKAAEQLGYAVIKGRAVKHLKTLGKSVGGDGGLLIGRAWLMMAQSAAEKMVSDLDAVIDDEDSEEDKLDAMNLKQKVVTSMLIAAKTMIDSSNGSSNDNRPTQIRPPGFGPGFTGAPIYPVQINLSPAVNQKPENKDVERVVVETKSSRRTGGNPSRKGSKDAKGDDQRDAE